MRKKASFRIEGMHCAACALSIENALKRLEGVESAEVSFGSGSAIVEYDLERVNAAALKRAIEEAGFRLATERTVFRIQDMECASCIQVLERGLLRKDGVVGVSADLATKRVFVDHVSSLVNVSELMEAMKKAGYTPEIAGGSVLKDGKGHKHGLLFSLALAVPVFVISMFLMDLPSREIVLFMLATAVQAVGGRVFYMGAIKSLRRRAPDMNVLVVLGTSAAYLYSVYNTFFSRGDLYYDAATMLIAFVLLGRHLEEAAKSRASLAIRRLLELQPKFALVLRGEEEVKVSVDELAPGDEVVIKPGDSIPADGTIVAGSTVVDESMVTGESMPVDKAEGDRVTGGTINKTGMIRVRVEKAGRDSFLAQIVNFVEEAQARKAPIQRFADLVASKFVPAVVLVATVTLIAWALAGKGMGFAIMMAASVLVIACPCALGLATPTAIMVGLGKGTEKGILIKGGEVLEAVQRINTIVFDKTGTLTVGKPAVVEVVDLVGVGNAKILKAAAALEAGSEHPLAAAIREEAARLEEGAGESAPKLESFEAFPGEGVRGRINGTDAILGNRKIYRRFGIQLGESDEIVSRMESEGKTASVLALEGRVVGIIGMSDRPKPDASAAIAGLKEEGLEVYMLTGDNERVAKTIGESIGIGKYFAEVSPHDKAQVIARLQSEGKRVAFVGDGINDAPALIQADVGIAIGSGTEIAKEAGGIILTKGDLSGVLHAIRLSKKTMSKIRQNMFWALIYNTAGIPIAAGVLYPYLTLRPEAAALAMSLSSVSVVTNSLLLRRYRG
ncbi:MAG: copper-translocating P-type ATPase [Candidatus Verstraetearchaeota archaeon]|nr:copper-translocating P-type ATPase [Candidatus Verstraetearchaeota archaeon]